MLEACQRATGLKPNEARALLGRFLFSGEEAEKPLDGLTGGERRRLSLAVLVQSGANVLILDEPTNHLDLESREALESALQAFPGALLLVSHDRALLDAVGTRTVAVEDRRCAPTSAAGPSTCGCARSAPSWSARPRRAAKAKPAPAKRRRRRRRRSRRVEEPAAPGAQARGRDRAGRGRAGGARGASWPTRRRGTTRVGAKVDGQHAAAKRRVEALYAELETVEEADGPRERTRISAARRSLLASAGSRAFDRRCPR